MLSSRLAVPTSPSPVRAIITILCLSMLGVPAPAPGQEVLTNDTVVTMVKAGLSESVILAKIRSSASKFDLRTDALVALKNAGIPDRVIEAMMSQGNPVGGTLPVQAEAAALPAAKARETIYHLNGERYVELEPQVIEVQTNAVMFSYKSEIVLRRRRATYRIPERHPVFVSSYAPTEALLVRLKPGDDRDDRNLKMGSAAFMPFGGTMRHGVRGEDRIEVASEKDSRGLYRISPRSPLSPGEYGFVVLTGGGANATGRIFDFGAD
jgi:hypothetical protein